MWFSFLMLDGLFLYGAIALFSLLALISMEHDRPGTCTVIVAVALVVLEYYSSIRPISFILAHPLDAVMIVAAYFGTGCVWIIVKWFSHVHYVKRRFNKIKDKIINQLRQTDGSNPKYFEKDGSLTDICVKYIYSDGASRLRERELPLQVSHHKADMYMWWLCWPLSIFWTVLGDWIASLWEIIYDFFGSFLQTISDNAFKLK